MTAAVAGAPEHRLVSKTPASASRALSPPAFSSSSKSASFSGPSGCKGASDNIWRKTDRAACRTPGSSSCRSTRTDDSNCGSLAPEICRTVAMRTAAESCFRSNKSRWSAGVGGGADSSTAASRSAGSEDSSCTASEGDTGDSDSGNVAGARVSSFKVARNWPAGPGFFRERNCSVARVIWRTPSGVPEIMPLSRGTAVSWSK